MSILIWLQESYTGNYLRTSVCVCVCGRWVWGGREGGGWGGGGAHPVNQTRDRVDIFPSLSFQLVFDWFCPAADTGPCWPVQLAAMVDCVHFQRFTLGWRLRLMMSSAGDEASEGKRPGKKPFFLFF